MQTSFIGIKTAQDPLDFLLWEKVLTGLTFARIIELGTYKWGMSLFFFLWCMTKKAQFYTYDNKFFPLTRVGRRLGLVRRYKMVDVFEAEAEIGKLIAEPGVSVVFCDGGNKPLELKTFSKYIKTGDLIAVHDWGTEVLESDVPDNMMMLVKGQMTAFFIHV